MTKFLGITVSIAISISTVESALVLLPVAFAQQAPGTPAQAAALFDKAWVLAQQGNHLDAVPIYEAALRILPRSIPDLAYGSIAIAHIGCNGARNLKAEIEADRTRRYEFHRDEYSIYR